MTVEMAFSLRGAMMCAPLTPGISAYSFRRSTQIALPSASGSAALSSRSIIQSGMIDPNRLLLIQRADFAEASGATPTNTCNRSGESAFRETGHIPAQNIRIHAELGLRELGARLDLFDQSIRHPSVGRVDGRVGNTDKKMS